MKKIVSLLLVLTFVCLAFISCGAKNKHFNYDLSEYIDLAEYKNIAAKTKKAEVTDEEVEEQIMATINYYARKNNVTDRPAQSGDYVTVDYAGYVDGVSENVVSIYDKEVAVGLGTLPEEFENAIIGMNRRSESRRHCPPRSVRRIPRILRQNSQPHSFCQVDLRA